MCSAATQLSGVRLAPGSTIDYVVVTAGDGGLSGDEIEAVDAVVHSDLASDPIAFRTCCSDHIPITTLIRVTDDTDGQ